MLNRVDGKKRGGIRAGGGIPGRRIAREPHGYAGAAIIDGGKNHLAAVFLDDLLDDREAKAGALFARGDIRFDDPLAVLRQADAVVGDRDRDRGAVSLPFAGHPHRDPSAIIIRRGAGAGFDGFDRVLEHVGHRLPDLMAIAQDMAQG